MALIGFARVSTLEQDLSMQIKSLTDYGCQKIFHGKNSGKEEENRERLQELLNYVREGDIVIITKLDRFGRSLRQILNVLAVFRDKNVGLKSLDGVVDTTMGENPFSVAQIQLIGAFAELERNLIRARLIEGKKAKGMLQGRPEKLTEEQFKDFKKDVARGASLSTLQKKYNIGRATVSRWKKKIKADALSNTLS
ncbi:recombinase family protein [Pasteurella multocida]